MTLNCKRQYTRRAQAYSRIQLRRNYVEITSLHQGRSLVKKRASVLALEISEIYTEDRPQ